MCNDLQTWSMYLSALGIALPAILPVILLIAMKLPGREPEHTLKKLLALVQKYSNK